MVVVVFCDSVCFSVGSADMNMPELIHWSCRVSLVPAALWLGGLQNTTSSEMH